MKPLAFATHIYKLSYLKTFYFEIPAAIVNKIGGIGKHRLHCEVNQSIKFQCGIIALGKGKAYISINSKRMKELNADLGDEVQLVLSEDTSEFGVDVPHELEELFKQDAEGKFRFDQLKQGMQRYILNYINSVKNQQLKIERSSMLINNLKNLAQGKETFKKILGK